MRVVLHSGGLDSTVCLLMAMAQARDVISLGFDYGQKHRIELEYADSQCKRFGIRRRVVKIEWDKPAREIPLDRNVDEIRDGGVSSAFLPGRNMIFLALGTAQACGIGATEVWIGVNSVDFSGYPDCRDEFIQQFRLTSECAIPQGPKILAPLQNLSKPQIAAKAQKLGLRSDDTWSCYRPRATPDGPVACDSCDACKWHAYAWKDLHH